MMDGHLTKGFPSQSARATIRSLGHRDEDGRAFSLEREGFPP